MKKKILFVQTSLVEAGGASVAQRSLINAAIVANFDVFAVTLDGSKYDKISESSFTNDFISNYSNRVSNLGFNKSVTNFIVKIGKSVNPDITIVGNVSWYFGVLEGIRHVSGDKYRIVHGAENFCLNSMLTKGKDRQMCEGQFGLKCLSNKCESLVRFPFKLGLHCIKNYLSSYIFDGFIVHSEFMFNKLQEVFMDRVFYLPLTTDIEFVLKNVKPKTESVLFIGSLVWHKGVTELIHAAKLLVERGNNVKLYLAGTGNERENLERFVQINALEENVKFLGILDRDEIIKAISNTEVVAFPSFFESFGLVALESMVLMKKLVISNRGALREIAATYPYAYFVEDITAECITLKIEEALNEDNMSRIWLNPYTIERLSSELKKMLD